MSLHEIGIVIKRGFITSPTIEAIKKEVDESTNVYLYPRHGIRNANKKFPSINNLSKSKEFLRYATRILGSNPEIARVIYFDTHYPSPLHGHKTYR